MLRRTPEAEAFLEAWLEVTTRGARLASSRPCGLVSAPSCSGGGPLALDEKAGSPHRRALALASCSAHSSCSPPTTSHHLPASPPISQHLPPSPPIARARLPPGELATDHLEPGVAQDASFVEHRHDQSLLSLLAKTRGLKSYPLPTTAHDVRDVWGWEAGYCRPDFEWATADPTSNPHTQPSPSPSPSPNLHP